VALRQVCNRAVRVFPVNSFPPTPHNRTHLNVALTSTTNERCLCIFQTAMLFRKLGSKGCKCVSLSPSFRPCPEAGDWWPVCRARRPGFDPGPVYVKFVVDRVVLDRIFSSYFASPLLTVFRPCFTLVHIHMSLLPGEKFAKPKNCQKCSAVLDIEERWVEKKIFF
jgi:hypothetical protein